MVRSWDEIHRVALTEATRAIHQLRIDRARRIDPFAALEAAGVVVMRRPLDHLAGIYLPAHLSVDGRPGVLIDVSHPPSKQRFTAAHELCHHRRDREAVLDLETEWIARGQAPTSERERIAEAFAAWFLTPRQLVESTIVNLEVQAGRLGPEDAYALALELGTSYAATVNHLADMRPVSRTQRDLLLKTPPQTIKRSLGSVDAVADSWRDIWLVRSPRQEAQIYIQEGDAVVVELSEVPSSGYLWHPASVSDGVALVREEYHGSEDLESLGGPGARRFFFRVDGPGRRKVRLELRRPWQKSAARAEERRLEIASEPKPAAGVVNPRRLATNAA